MNDETQKKPPFTLEALWALTQENPNFEWLEFFDFGHLSSQEIEDLAVEADKAAIYWIGAGKTLRAHIEKH